MRGTKHYAVALYYAAATRMPGETERKRWKRWLVSISNEGLETIEPEERGAITFRVREGDEPQSMIMAERLAEAASAIGDEELTHADVEVFYDDEEHGFAERSRSALEAGETRTSIMTLRGVLNVVLRWRRPVWVCWADYDKDGRTTVLWERK